MQENEDISVESSSDDVALGDIVDAKSTSESDLSDEQSDEENSDDSETSGNEQEENDDEQAVEKKPKKSKGGFQRRINKLNSKLSEKEKEAAYWREQALKAQRLESNDSKEKARPVLKNDGKPDPDDFESHEEYVEALTDWKVEGKISAYEEKKRNEAIQNEFKSKAKTHAARVNSFVAKHPDFHEVLEEVSDVKLPHAVQEVIIDSELGPEIMYELAKDQDELERICSLGPLAAAKAIGRLESNLGSSKGGSEKSINKKISKAPNPPTPIRSKSEKSTKRSIFDEDLSQAEYEALRRKQRSR